jgi:hypothetical protein
MATLIAVAGSAHAQTLTDARGFVTGLYAAYAHSEPDYLGPMAHQVFSPRLLGLIRRDERNAHGEVGALDGDPICDCQDPDGVRLVALDIAAAGPGRATARVRLRFEGGRAEAMTLDLVSIRGHWRIDEVRSPDTPSLVRLLGG